MDGWLAGWLDDGFVAGLDGWLGRVGLGWVRLFGSFNETKSKYEHYKTKHPHTPTNNIGGRNRNGTAAASQGGIHNNKNSLRQTSNESSFIFKIHYFLFVVVDDVAALLLLFWQHNHNFQRERARVVGCCRWHCWPPVVGSKFTKNILPKTMRMNNMQSMNIWIIQQNYAGKGFFLASVLRTTCQLPTGSVQSIGSTSSRHT